MSTNTLIKPGIKPYKFYILRTVIKPRHAHINDQTLPTQSGNCHSLDTLHWLGVSVITRRLFF